MASSEMNKFVRELRKAGLTVTLASGGHWRAQCPEGLVFFAASPGDGRWRQNALAELRRKGFTLKP